MTTTVTPISGTVADALFQWLNPVPYGMFFAALIFDACYAATADIMWAHAASWLGALGLFFAIIPRVINLCHVWFGARFRRRPTARLDFWLNLLAIVVAIFNALIHTRDAYGIVPMNVVLSAIVVVLLSAANILSVFGLERPREVR